MHGKIPFGTGSRSVGGKFRRAHGLPSLAAGICLMLAAAAEAQPMESAQDPAALYSLDSLKRVITRRILSEADKKEIRACDREKAQSLKQCRAADTAGAQVDRKLDEAKRAGGDPDDPAIQSLLERKFSLEKGCDEAFAATARGRQCLAGEGKRRDALEKALKKDKPYQALLKKTEAAGPEPL